MPYAMPRFSRALLWSWVELFHLLRSSHLSNVWHNQIFNPRCAYGGGGRGAFHMLVLLLVPCRLPFSRSPPSFLLGISPTLVFFESATSSLQ